MLKSKTLTIILISFLSLVGVYYLANSLGNKLIPSDDSATTNQLEGPKDIGKRNGNQINGNSIEGCLADDCLAINNLDYPVSELPSEVVDSLNKALDDEYKAFSTYEAVISNFGNIRPFIMIIRAEEQHISSLKSIFDKYGINIPENPYIGKIEAPKSVATACSVGVQAEIDNASLYRDKLLPAVDEYDDITSVFTNLMNASQEKHLPAFERCSN